MKSVEKRNIDPTSKIYSWIKNKVKEEKRFIILELRTKWGKERIIRELETSTIFIILKLRTKWGAKELFVNYGQRQELTM